MPVNTRAVLEAAAVQREAQSGANVSGTVRNLAKHTPAVNVETSNLTVILEHIEVDSRSPDAPWMFTYNNSPFVQEKNLSLYGNTKMSWNADGRGNGTCSSGGSGRMSRGYLDPYNYYLGLSSPPDFDKVSVELRNLSLSDFLHINTVNSAGAWNTMGEAGDTRRYSHGYFNIFKEDRVLLSSKNVQWIQNVSYPGPIGEAREGALSVGAYFVAEIQNFKSDAEWVHQLDPNGLGYVLGVLTAASFGPTSCFSSNSYWVSVRGFPDFSDESSAGDYSTGGHRNGAKVGLYKGSSDSAIATARALAGVAKSVVITVVGAVVSGALAGAASAALVPGASSGPPGQGLVRLIGTAAFVAKVNEIHGFHSDAMAEFGDGLKIFIGKVEWPFAADTVTSRVANSIVGEGLRSAGRSVGNSSDFFTSGVMRQEAQNSEISISDELFGGCAFYTSLIVMSFLILHGLIWLATRKKPLRQQLVPHAWMIYLFSVVMSHVYRAAVLNSMQYMRSHVSVGTGKAGLYVIAVLQLLLIGVGFTAFFVTVMVLALKRMWRKEVKWIPKQEMADPDMRRSTIITGEYQVDDNNAFHVLFECYYSSLAGPRVWLASLELGIVFLDAICTALIWNEIVCLGILVCVYAFLFALFLILTPFVDRIEGGLVVVLGLVELVLLIMDFLGALGDYDAAENMEFGALILGFVAIGLAVVIAIYCDLIPIVASLWSAARRRFRKEIIVDGKLEQQENSDVASDWSGLSRSDSVAGRSVRLSDNEGNEFEGDATKVNELSGLVAYNAEREQEVRDLLSAMFDNEGEREQGGQGRGSQNSRVVIDPRTHETGRGRAGMETPDICEAGLLGVVEDYPGQGRQECDQKARIISSTGRRVT